jgi:methylenetetrahydrofolate--tRNA-(uracil-5-)-methyltransferase
MNVNFGLFPPLEAPTLAPDGRRLKGKERGGGRKRLIAERALADLGPWLALTGRRDAA